MCGKLCVCVCVLIASLMCATTVWCSLSLFLTFSRTMPLFDNQWKPVLVLAVISSSSSSR